MDKLKIFCKGVDAKMISSKLVPITSGSKNYYKARFVFTHEWDKFTKTAVFFNNKTSGVRYPVALTQVTPSYSKFPNYEIWECVIPYDVINGFGTLYTGVIGTIGTGDTQVILNSTAVFREIDFGITDLTAIQSPAPDIYQTLLQEIAEIQRNSQANWTETNTASMQYILNKDDVEEAVSWEVLPSSGQT